MTRVAELMARDRTYIVLAYFGLVGVVVALYFHQTEISKQQAERQAAANARVAQCIQSIPNARKINRFIRGVQEFHRVAAMNSRATVQSTPTSDPQYKTRLANYMRIRATVADVSGVHFHVPTVAECRTLGSRNP